MEAADRFGSLVKRARKALDLSQKDLAAQIGCALVTIQKIEEGQRKPSRQIAELLSRCLEIPSSDVDLFLKLARAPLDPPSCTNHAISSSTSNIVAPPANLPALLAPYIGRVAETEALLKLLGEPNTRLVTLVGPPGVGKTRLSIEAATQAALLQTAGQERALYPDGTWFVSLAPLQNPDLVLPTLAHVLHIGDPGQSDPIERLSGRLAGKTMLIVLDNCEHLLAGLPQVGALLVACRGLKVLATSRVPLELYGERVFRIEPLALPVDCDLTDPDCLLGYDAVAMFMERARAVRPEFTLTPENALKVTNMCRRLEGLPLAIELATAALYRLTFPELLSQVETTQELLSGLHSEIRNISDRQRSLKNTIEWSYTLLNEQERSVYRGLAVFPGSFSRLAAIQVFAHLENGNPGSVVASLHTLAHHNLLQTLQNTAGEICYTKLELIRADANERCVQAGELDSLRERHAQWCLDTIALSQVEGENEHYPVQSHLQIDDLRAALNWLHETGDGQRMLQLCTVLRYYWEYSGYQREGKDWLAKALALPGAAPSELRAQALLDGCVLAFQQGDYAKAQVWGEESARLFQAMGDSPQLAIAWITLGRVAIEQGAYEIAEAWEESAWDLSRSIQYSYGMAGALCHLAEIALGRDDDARATAMAEEYLALTASMNKTIWDVLLGVTLSEVNLRQENLDQARKHLLASLDIGLTLKAVRFVTLALAVAASLLTHAPGNPQERALQAARLWGAVTTIRQNLGLAFSIGHCHRFAAYLEPARTALGSEAWQQAEHLGQRISLESAVDLAHSILT